MLWLVLGAGAVVAAVLQRIEARGLMRDGPPGSDVLVALAAATAVVVDGAAPTGWQPLDVALTGGAVLTVVLLGGAAGNLAATWAAAIAAAVTVLLEAPRAPIAVAALGVGAVALVGGSRTRVLSGLVVAGALVSLAEVPWPERHGAASAAALLAAGPVVVAGLARTGSRGRRAVAIGSVVGAAVAVVGISVAGSSVLLARADLDAAVSAAQAGLDAVGESEETARERLAEAADHFDRAAGVLGSWWSRPARLVPVVAQHVRAADTMASSGAELARIALTVLDEADVDAVGPVDGVVDLAALARLAGPLHRSATGLERAEARLTGVRSGWLLSPLDDRLGDLDRRVTEARARSEQAALAVEVALEMLGRERPHRYFLMLQTPAELRGVGGFMGSWAELVADGGRLELTRTGRVGELSDGGPDPDARRIVGEQEFVARYGQQPARHWGLIGFSPDFPTVARIIRQLYPESGGAPIDGVFAMDPAAFAAFLELTGPVEVPGYPEPFSAERAEEILLHEQYLAFRESTRRQREEFLATATEALFDRLTTGEVPGPRRTARVLGPSVAGRHLQLWSPEPRAQALFAELGADGAVSPPAVDSIGIVGQNFGGDKLDYFLRREVRYDLRWDPAEASLEGEVVVRLTNLADPEGLPRSILGPGGDPALGQLTSDDGENVHRLSLYAAVPLHGATLDGEPIDVESDTELGHQVLSAYVRLQPGQTRTLRARMNATLLGDRYVLEPVRQPTVEPDVLEVRISIAPGWRAAVVEGATIERAAGEVEASWTLDTPRRLEVRVRPDRRPWRDTLLGR